MKPHILVIDDDDRIRLLLRKYLHEHDFIVSMAKNAKEAKEAIAVFHFDLLIVDVMMPGETGVELVEYLRNISDIPAIMLTAKDNSEDRILGLEKGADDYLGKPFEPKELLLRINKILHRHKNYHRNKFYIGEMEFDYNKSCLYKGKEVIPLTNNENNLLYLMSKELGKVFSREELAKNFALASDRSIDVMIIRLRSKIELDPKQPMYLKTVRGQGYGLFP